MPKLDGLPEVHYFDGFRDEALAAQAAGPSPVTTPEVEPEQVAPKKTRKSTKKA